MSLNSSEIADSLHRQLNKVDLHYVSTTADAADALVDVLPYLGGVLGLHGMACLASSSRHLRHECIEFVKNNATLLAMESLPATIAEDSLAAVAEAAAVAALPYGYAWRAAARATAAAAAVEHLQPVSWLLDMAPSSSTSVLAAADVLQRLLHLPHVHLQQAKQLVAAGVRIPYAQLLSAASSMVGGVEVWVQAQQQLGVASDIPAAAVAICCYQDWVSAHDKQEVLMETSLRSAFWTAAAGRGSLKNLLFCQHGKENAVISIAGSSAPLFTAPVLVKKRLCRRCCAELHPDTSSRRCCVPTAAGRELQQLDHGNYCSRASARPAPTKLCAQAVPDSSCAAALEGRCIVSAPPSRQAAPGCVYLMHGGADISVRCW
jgi:hypothetical protein